MPDRKHWKPAFLKNPYKFSAFAIFIILCMGIYVFMPNETSPIGNVSATFGDPVFAGNYIYNVTIFSDNGTQIKEFLAGSTTTTMNVGDTIDKMYIYINLNQDIDAMLPPGYSFSDQDENRYALWNHFTVSITNPAGTITPIDWDSMIIKSYQIGFVAGGSDTRIGWQVDDIGYQIASKGVYTITVEWGILEG